MEFKGCVVGGHELMSDSLLLEKQQGEHLNGTGLSEGMQRWSQVGVSCGPAITYRKETRFI